MVEFNQASSLSVIDLKGRAIGVCDELLQALAQCSCLTHLDLSGNCLTAEAVNALVSTLLQPDSPRLRHLNLADNVELKSSGLCQLARALAGSVWLEMLDISNTGVDQRSLEWFFNKIWVWL